MNAGAKLDEMAEQLRALMVRVQEVLDQRDALVRSLLAVEWEGDSPDETPTCPACAGHGLRFDAARMASVAKYEHRPGCHLDAALSAAGLDTQEKRDAARKEFGR